MTVLAGCLLFINIPTLPEIFFLRTWLLCMDDVCPVVSSLTHMHKQCESMEWRKRWAFLGAVYQTFSTNHLSYTKTLVPIYIFRAITFLLWCRYFLWKKWPFCPKITKLCRELFFEKP